MRIEVYVGEHGDTLLFVGNFPALPRIGETVSKDAGGYFDYYEMTDVWYRDEPTSGQFQACISVQLNV